MSELLRNSAACVSCGLAAMECCCLALPNAVPVRNAGFPRLAGVSYGTGPNALPAGVLPLPRTLDAVLDARHDDATRVRAERSRLELARQRSEQAGQAKDRRRGVANAANDLLLPPWLPVRELLIRS